MKVVGSVAATVFCLILAAGAAAAELEAHTPSAKETMDGGGQISHELSQIDARLGKIEPSILSIDASLAPAG
jgi:hypothetical protein